MADNFRSHSKAVLRVAYTRFIHSIKKRLKISKIITILKSLYFKYIKKSCFGLWTQFHIKKQFMIRSCRIRGYEILSLNFARWKVFTVLEKHFQKSSRCKILKNVFTQWKQNTKNSKWENWAVSTEKYFQIKMFKKKIFRAWKYSCTFLEWNSKKSIEYEFVALRHYMKSILQHWKIAARMSRHQLQSLEYNVVYISKLTFHFSAWRELCQMNWKTRGNLIKRFFVSTKVMIEKQKQMREGLMLAFSSWTGTRMHQALRIWLRLTRLKRRHSIGNAHQNLLVRFIFFRLLFI